MSVAVASSQPLAGTAGGEDRGGSRWLAGGVAAELSDLLSAPVGFIRVLMLIVIWAQPSLIYLYVFAALAIPRAGRRLPSWSNLIAGARVGLLYLLVLNLFSADGVLINNGGTVFGQGPAVWLPFAGATLFGVVVLVFGAKPSALRDPVRDRALALASLGTLAAVGLVALGVALVPSVSWAPALGALAVLGGAVLALGGRRAEPMVVPVVLLAACAVLVARAGVRLQGGIGNETVAPARVAAVHTAYRRAIGTLNVNLTALSRDPRPLVLTASVGIGDLHVLVPADAAVSLTVHVGRGSVEVLTCSTRSDLIPHYWLDRAASFSLPAHGPACGFPLRRPLLRLRILASVGIGNIQVTEPPWVTEGPN